MQISWIQWRVVTNRALRVIQVPTVLTMNAGRSTCFVPIQRPRLSRQTEILRAFSRKPRSAYFPLFSAYDWYSGVTLWSDQVLSNNKGCFICNDHRGTDKTPTRESCVAWHRNCARHLTTRKISLKIVGDWNGSSVSDENNRKMWVGPGPMDEMRTI